MVAARSLPGFSSRGRPQCSPGCPLPERISQHHCLQSSATRRLQECGERQRRIRRLAGSKIAGRNRCASRSLKLPMWRGRPRPRLLAFPLVFAGRGRPRPTCTKSASPCRMPLPNLMITLADVQAALERIRPSIYLSPCTLSATFSQLTGNSIYLKLDNLQRTGAFKERGALNKLLTMSAQERDQGVIAASAGNHAQGLAYHAGRRGIKAQICMPLTTPLIKVSATKSYGAEVILHRRKLRRSLRRSHPAQPAATSHLRPSFR